MNTITSSVNNILVIGDSGASAVCSTPTGDIDHAGWPQMMGIPSNNIQGVSGTTAQQWAINFEGRLQKAINTPADVLIVSLLANDARFSSNINNTTLSLPNQNLINLWILELSTILKVVKKKRTIVLQYTKPLYIHSPLYDQFTTILDNAIAVAVSKVAGVELFDSRTVLTDPAMFYTNSFHTNALGHAAMNTALKKLIGIS